MSHLPIKLIVLLCAITAVSCGFIDLRPIGYSVEPGAMDSVLSDPFTPIIVKFDTEMERKNAEGIIQVSSDTGAVNGDVFWRGNHLYFAPVQGWTAGVRYTLSLIGTIQSLDGRELRLERFISFYAINRNDPPVLLWHYPANGESIGTNNAVLEFHFSRAMDRLSTESALTTEGIGNKTIEWSDDDRVLKVISERTLVPWSSYRWSLRDSAKSADGVPLPKTYSGYFTTDLDQTLPEVLRAYPVLNSGGIWYPTGLCIETGQASGQGIAVEFNKPIGDSALRSLRFEPALTGRTEFLSDRIIVFIPARDPEPEVSYTLIVSSDTRDTEGLKLGTEYRINFIPDIPFLNILSFNANGAPVMERFSPANLLKVSVDPGTGETFFSIRFSLPFTMEEKLSAAQKITLTPFFPRTLSPVALKNVSWYFEDRIFMCWEGLKAGSATEPHYYTLTIPGGRGGVNTGSGMYMKEDIVFYLEAVNEN